MRLRAEPEREYRGQKKCGAALDPAHGESSRAVFRRWCLGLGAISNAV
jgi:hypothetical protein